MVFQSSFLIRCFLGPDAQPGPAKAFQIQHVQSGAEFRSPDLAAVVQWMTTENLRYLQEMLSREIRTEDGGNL